MGLGLMSSPSVSNTAALPIQNNLINTIINDNDNTDEKAITFSPDVLYVANYFDACDMTPFAQDIEKKAEQVCNDYINRSMQGRENINSNKKKTSYARAVRTEIPGAPVKKHCVYSQYTQLKRALHENGDTVTVVPSSANAACSSFRTNMRALYKNTPGCIYEGRMYQSDAELNKALNKFLSTKTGDTTALRKQFLAKNFSVDQLTPGAMLLVQNKSGGDHMVMFAGRGRIDGGKFVADQNGIPVYSGYNHESMGNIYSCFGTNNVFAANTENILTQRYTQELKKLLTSSDNDLIKYLQDKGAYNLLPYVPSREQLIQMVANTYFNRPSDNTICFKSANDIIYQNTYLARNR